MAIYGFGEETARQLMKVARREGLKTRGSSFLGYPEALNSTPPELLVKNATGSDIAVNTSGTFQIWTGTPGSESNSGDTIVAYNKTSTAFKDGKFGSAGWLNGEAYVTPWQT